MGELKTRVGTGDIKTLNFDALFSAFSAANASSSIPYNMLEGITKILDALQTGKDLRNLIDNEIDVRSMEKERNGDPNEEVLWERPSCNGQFSSRDTTDHNDARRKEFGPYKRIEQEEKQKDEE